MAKNWNSLSTNLELLLDEVKFQRRKDARRLFKEDNGFVVLHGTTHWTDLFVRHFLFETDRSIDSDDLLFFIRKRHVKGTTRYLPKFETEVEVFRRDSKKLPIGDPDIAWEETVYLNLIIHQFDYTVTLAICTRTSPKDLQVLKRHSQPVYASPSRRRMDVKGDVEEFTYPNICFMVDNFDEVFEDMHVRDGEMVCVELVASDRQGTVQGVLFLGSIRYEALKKVYDTRASLSSKMAQRMTFGWYGGASSQRMEFVRMKGPQGKGHAEMAVTKPKGSGLDTPSSEPGLSVTELWDSDWESEPEDFYSTTRQRRLSDPSGNSNGYRGNWRVKPDSSQSRSENEGLDRYSNGVSEIEAGDLRDGLPSVAEVPEAGPETWDKPSEGGVADDSNKPPSFSPPLIPPYTQMRKSRSFDCSSPMTSTSFVPGGSRIPLSPPSSTSPTPPFCQVLSNGTRVHYYCNIVQAQANLPTRRELDDGVCNPLWTMRGFTQTFHFWKENRRAQSVPLNALLTYVTLPWYTIISDILDRRESPILTF